MIFAAGTHAVVTRTRQLTLLMLIQQKSTASHSTLTVSSSLRLDLPTRSVIVSQLERLFNTSVRGKGWMSFHRKRNIGNGEAMGPSHSDH